MTVGFLALAIPNVINETSGNPLITQMGANSNLGAMEAKKFVLVVLLQVIGVLQLL